ncbi:MAG TPA: hypothetical protein PLH27_03185 [bacterium]|nr:hypothetical protein [bacterium]HMY34979.1 hypothetical protein [bacterium]HMZ03476.1 hypothetical protein [bacterium]HNB07997.1 hypothetical protein [bacterium]HNB56735.1 hypothetical protein [bacterium]
MCKESLLLIILILIGCSKTPKQNVPTAFNDSLLAATSIEDSIQDVADTLTRFDGLLPAFFVPVGKYGYGLPNLIGGKRVLPSYKNYLSMSDTIDLSKIRYILKQDSVLIIVADISGLRTGLILALKRTSKDYLLLSAEEIGSVKTWSLSNSINSSMLFEVTSYPYSIMCEMMQGYHVFKLDNRFGLIRVFDGVLFMTYSEKSELCPENTSYVQEFELSQSGNKILLRALKLDEKGLKTEKRYVLGTDKFYPIQ